MGPLGKIASFFKNVPLENQKNSKGKALGYNNASAWHGGASFHRRSPGWSSLRLTHSRKGECHIT
jgi:hypothetical protein